jgi:hypothetical protein
LALVALALLPACGGEGVETMDPPRWRDAWDPPAASDADAARRLGFTRTREDGPPEFAWDAPEGWEPLPPSPFRAAGFRVAGRDDATISVSITGGGVLANLNRWRDQMGLEPVTEAALGDLPRRPLLGGSAVVVDLAGDYEGMGGTGAVPAARLLGLIATLPVGTVFVKMVGPGAVVGDERDRFEAFATSLRLEAAPHGHEDVPFEGHPPIPGPAPAPARPPTVPKIRWTVPPGWVEVPPRPEHRIRVVTVRPEGASATECYVTVLTGLAGGVAANLNLWRDQMGQEPLSEAEFAALRRVPVLGDSGVYLRVEGRYRGKVDEDVADAMLLGLVCVRDDDTVFVKMTGPTAEVAPAEEGFLDFVRSLHE